MSAADNETVIALRDRTGMGLADCLAALITTNGDSAAAAAILTRHAASQVADAAPLGFWHYACDFGHDWVIYRAVDGDEIPDDARCPHCSHGHEAVTLKVMRHADRTRVSLVPVARVVPTGRGEGIIAEDRYRVAIARIDGTGERLSAGEYEWDEAAALAGEFRRLAFFQSLGAWERIKP